MKEYSIMEESKNIYIKSGVITLIYSLVCFLSFKYFISVFSLTISLPYVLGLFLCGLLGFNNIYVIFPIIFCIIWAFLIGYMNLKNKKNIKTK